MKFQALLFAFVVTISLISAVSIDHDKVQPIAQPEPVTDSEKAAVKFKPSFYNFLGCATYPAVNAAGEISGGLKGTGGDSGCKVSLLGSQVYGRATWHNDVWAIMYAWYFPKGFWGPLPSRRHDWASVVVWIDSPVLEWPTIVGLSLSINDKKYDKVAPPPGPVVDGTTPKMCHSVEPLFGGAFMDYTISRGDFQDLIMWEQLPDEARTALNSTDFGKAKVPFIDAEFTERLEKAWPF